MPMTKALYQIKRIPIARGYRFELINEYTRGVVLTAFGLSLVAPVWLRKRQARLNTIYVLDGYDPIEQNSVRVSQ
jgi:hypothetical protein